MNPIFYSPCSECKRKTERFNDMYWFCDVCAFTINKKKYERITSRIMKVLNEDEDEKEDNAIHSKWVFSSYEGEPWCECLNCGFVPSKKAYKESHKCCSECGAIMNEK